MLIFTNGLYVFIINHYQNINDKFENIKNVYAIEFVDLGLAWVFWNLNQQITRLTAILAINLNSLFNKQKNIIIRIKRLILFVKKIQMLYVTFSGIALAGSQMARWKEDCMYTPSPIDGIG